MKAQYVERGHDRSRTHGFVVHDTENPVPQTRLEETLFNDTAFKVSERPAPKLASSN